MKHDDSPDAVRMRSSKLNCDARAYVRQHGELGALQLFAMKQLFGRSVSLGVAIIPAFLRVFPAIHNPVATPSTARGARDSVSLFGPSIRTV